MLLTSFEGQVRILCLVALAAIGYFCAEKSKPTKYPVLRSTITFTEEDLKIGSAVQKVDETYFYTYVFLYTGDFDQVYVRSKIINGFKEDLLLRKGILVIKSVISKKKPKEQMYGIYTYTKDKTRRLSGQINVWAQNDE